VTCDSPPDQCHLTNGTCGSDGTCTYGLKAAGSSCDDGKACTTADVCDAAGACAGSTTCNSPPATACDASKPISHGYQAAGSCNTTGSCTYVGVDKNCATGCNTTNGLCNDDPCAGVICNAPSGPCYNPVGTCSAGQCTYAPRDGSAQCDDGVQCTTGDHCDGNGHCAGTNDCVDGGAGTGGLTGTGGLAGTGGLTDAGSSTGGASSGGTSAGSGGAASTGGRVSATGGDTGNPGSVDAGVDSGTSSLGGGGGSSGCDCSVPRSSRQTPWALGLLALSLLAARRSKRSRD